MKPKKIFLIRHGQSEGNADPKTYETKPDYQLLLTKMGRDQALVAGMELKKTIGLGRIKFYISPLWRTRETFKNIVYSFNPQQYDYQEEPRIREQEWGHCRSVEENKKINEERDKYGTFYYRLPDGESGADVYDRMSTFMETLHRDFAKVDFPENCCLVMHGMSIRLFLMKWFHLTVEDFEYMKNPANCQIFTLVKGPNDKYTLETEVERYEVLDEYRKKNQNPLVI